MHHLTTLNLPTPAAKDADRHMLAAWLAEAGVDESKIETSPIEGRAPTGGQWVSKSITSPELREQLANRYAAPVSLELIEKLRKLAAQGLTRSAAARALGIGTTRARRIAELHGIAFTAKRGRSQV